MISRILSLVSRPIVLAPLLKGVAYTSTTVAICYPKMFWLFATISGISGTSFYILLGAAAFAPAMRGFRRLGRTCKVGSIGDDGNIITRHDCWL